MALHRKPKKPRPLREPVANPPGVDESAHVQAECYELPTLSSAKDELGGQMSDDTAEVKRKRSERYKDAVKFFGMRMALRRRECELTVRDLEERTGIDKATLSRIAAGEQPEMTVGNFFAICEALAMDPLQAWYGPTGKPRRSEPPPASPSRAK